MNKYQVFIFLVIVNFLTALAEDVVPSTIMRASYHYRMMDTKRNGDETVNEDQFILQIAPRESYFFSKTAYDYVTLMATKEGKELMKSLMREATTREGNVVMINMQKVADRIPKQGMSMRVYKYHDKGSMEVFNTLPDEKVVYTVEMADLKWELTDSVKTVLGYECSQAVADYHGRRWTAWFSPDIPVQEGPWQLCGLYGLIMEAETEGGEFRFEITGLEQVSEPMADFMVKEDDLFRYKRKQYLREKRGYKEDPGKVARGMGGKATWADGSPVQKITLHHDLIETDYMD